jgi:hypothetical protein
VMHVIEGGSQPPARAKDPKPAAMLHCRRCGGREVIEAKIGVTLEKGKAKGGTKVLLCAVCMCRGERVVLG